MPTPTCYADLHLKNDWTQQGDSSGAHGACGIVPGVGLAPMAIHFTPATRPPGDPWDNAYVLHRNPASGATMWVYNTVVRFPSLRDVTDCEAFEKDFQKNDSHCIFNLGWQYLFGKGLRVWNRSANGGKGSWGNPVLQLPPGLDQCLPTRLTALFSHDASNVYYHGVAFNGLWHALNVSFPAVVEAQNPYVNNAVQLDSKGGGGSISLDVYECSVVGY